MQIDWELANRIQCGKEDKDHCLKIVTTMVSMMEQARREGLLALEDGIEKISPFYFQKGLQMILDGSDPEDIKRIMISIVVSGNYRGAELLERMVILEGILSLQMGDNPMIGKLKMLSLLGEDYVQKYA